MAAVRSRKFAALTLLCLTLCGQNSANAQVAPSEYDLKAAFVYQFLSYVSWPESKAAGDGSLVIGVVGAPELADNLAALSRNQNPGARMIQVRTLQPGADPRDLHVLFVAASAGAQDALLQVAVESAVVTITEQLPRPPHSVINFEVIESKVRFDVAQGLANQHGLDISGRLLQVALRVLE